MESSSQSKKKLKRSPKKHNIKLYKKIYNFRNKHKCVFYVVYVPLRWLILKEQSLMAFAASYFFLVFLFFIPIFLIIWVYFPMVGIEHGKSVAESRIENYKENLCENKEYYWSKCVELSTAHIKAYKTPALVKGILILRRGNLLGVFTENGPVTMSMPNNYYYKAERNGCYGGCDKEKRITKSSKATPKSGAL